MATKTAEKTNTNTPAADEIDEMLGGGGDDLDSALDGLTGGGANEEEEVDLSSLNLQGIIEIDFRPLPDGAWFDAEIVSAKGGRSGSGNLQVEFVYQVISDNDRNGITVMDQAGVDPRSPKQHWKIKKIAKRVGLLSDNDILLTKNPKDFIGRRLKFQNKWDTEYDAKGRNKANDYDSPTEPNVPFVPAG